MKLATFNFEGKTRIGAVVGDWIVDSLGVQAIPEDMIGFLEGGASSIDAMQKLIVKNVQRIALADVILQAPVPRPGKFLGVGLNYADHVDETELEKPEYPTFFTKQSSCVIGPGAAIHRPKVSEKLDYEGELAFIIGKRCRHVAIDKAHEVIAGYTIANDVSVRDWQFRSATWTLGKSFDTHGPLGPWLVTPDEIGDPHQLSLETWLDDEKRQSSNTRHMIFNCFEIIAYLTQAMTLEPGDVITTGTPAGVGVKMKPRGYMKPGQTVRITIEKIGTLINPVIAEPNSIFPVK
ncbi:fumarylacetoacetate hydrolase family protein [Methylicorpusculum oleiharenae]|uniref:fumarylacetoacetate hydrolase family protein n=1 Tax=Methylicorpusculum oleiharenae TaxID=1338687 RepID=UPI001359DA1E|nr:fumarylacetoacetate hydrolase family protein [Methylicorpusculum oleiharenae]MCD2449247.1 fumarylacetoacetate hydrolase family protein [Methylicorpusculum oleiharenae]